MARRERVFVKRKPDGDDQLISAQQVAQLLGIHKLTVLRWHAEGHLPRARKIGRGKNAKHVWWRSTIVRWVEEQECD